MDKPLQITAQITGIENKFYQDSNSSAYTLVTDKGKFKFNQKKKDTGEETTAYQQFQKFGFKSGDTIEIAYFTSKESFINDKGKSVTYDKNTVAYFPSDDNGSPKAPIMLKTNQNPIDGQNLSKLEARVATIERILNDNGIFEIPVI
jgi:adenine specific DNA methylase Mod